MPAFLAALGGVLINIVGHVVGRVLVSLGIAVITYVGMNFTIDWLKGQAVMAFAGLPADVMGLLGTMRVGQCISIVSSAILARMMVTGMAGDTFKKWVLK